MAKEQKTDSHTLSQITTEEISLVPEGAIKRRFVFKKENHMPMTDVQKEALLSLFEADIVKESDLTAYLAKAELDEETQEAVKNAMRVLQAVEDKLPEDLLPMLGQLLGMPGSVEVEAEADAEKDTEKDSDADKEEDDADKEDDVEMTKALQKERDHYTAELAKANKKTAELAKALEDEKEIRKAREYADMAEGYTVVGVDKDTLAGMLRKADDAGMGDQFRDLCAAGTGFVKESGLMERIGKNSVKPDANSPEVQFETLKKELHTKHPEKTADQITVMASDIDPDLAYAANQ